MTPSRDWHELIHARLQQESPAAPVAREAIDELAAHLDDVYRAAQRQGLDDAAAIATATAELDGLGPLAQALERRRPAGRRAPLLRGLAEDARHAARALARRRGFSVTVLATLALGIAVNTVAFSMVNAILLRDVPYRDPARLAFMWSKLAWVGVPRGWASGPHIARLTREAKTVEDIAAIRTNTDHLTSGGAPVLVRSGITSANLFDMLSVRPMLGHGFVKADEPLNVTILSYGLWQQRFGGDPSIVGKSVEISGAPMEVIGVLPESFHFLVHSSLGDPLSADLWLPTDWQLDQRSDGSFGFAALLRVKPPYSLADAQHELDAIGAEVDRVRFRSKGFGWQLTGVRDDLVRESRSTLLVVAAGAAFLLAVIAANIAGLMTVRNAERRREFAVRAALGAGRWQIGRLVLVESLGLALAAGAIGTALAWAAVRAIVATEALPLPRLAEVSIDWRVALFTTGLSLLAGLVFGVAPALRVRGDADPLREGARGSSARAPWFRGVLVAAELAIAAVLIAGSTLLIRSYIAIERVAPGFSGDGVLTARITLDQSRYPDEAAAVAVQARYAERIAAIPGVVAAGGASSLPLSGNTDQSEAHAMDAPAGVQTMSDIIRTSPGYFRAMGTRVLSGRDFTAADRAGAGLVAIVDERMAAALWPNGSAVGQRISLDGGPALTVVGVVEHARQYQIEQDGREQVFRPYAQDATGSLDVALRTNGDPAALIGPLRAAIADVDPKQPISKVEPMSRVVDDALASRRLQLAVLGAFAGGAALLAAFGVYGVLSSIVVSRRRELGIRLALGATGARVRGLVVREMAMLAGAGAAIGLVAAFAASRLIAHLLFGVTAHDAASYATTAAVLALSAGVAAWIPVRRATRLDPTVALRDE